jgi:hypothetical protein
LLSASNSSAPRLPFARVFLLFKLIKPLVLIVVLVGAYLLAPTIGDVNGKTLHRGVVAELGGTSDVGSKSCAKRGSVTWRCRVYAKGGSDPATYAVRMRDGRCWSARRASAYSGGGEPLAPRASGCLHLRDQLPTVSSLTG